MKLENYSILTLFRCQLLFRHFHNDTDILTRKKIDKYYILPPPHSENIKKHLVFWYFKKV